MIEYTTSAQTRACWLVRVYIVQKSRRILVTPGTGHTRTVFIIHARNRKYACTCVHPQNHPCSPALSSIYQTHHFGDHHWTDAKLNWMNSSALNLSCLSFLKCMFVLLPVRAGLGGLTLDSEEWQGRNYDHWWMLIFIDRDLQGMV